MTRPRGGGWQAISRPQTEPQCTSVLDRSRMMAASRTVGLNRMAIVSGPFRSNGTREQLTLVWPQPTLKSEAVEVRRPSGETSKRRKARAATGLFGEVRQGHKCVGGAYCNTINRAAGDLGRPAESHEVADLSAGESSSIEVRSRQERIEALAVEERPPASSSARRSAGPRQSHSSRGAFKTRCAGIVPLGRRSANMPHPSFNFFSQVKPALRGTRAQTSPHREIS
jgi:hypothetical protein